MRGITFILACHLLFLSSFTVCLQSKNKSAEHLNLKDRNLKEVAKKIEKNFLSLSYPATRKEGGFSFSIPRKLDIIIALDASFGPIQEHFEYQKKLAKVLIEGFSISPSNTRVAMASCSSNYVHFNFFLKTHVNKECLVGFIPFLRYIHEGRALGKCLQSIHWQAFVKSHDIRRDAKKVLFIVSTGESPDIKSSTYAKILKHKGVKIFGLSIGADENGYKQIQGIVSRPVRQHAFRVPNMASITPLINLLRGKGYYSTKCKDNGKPIYDECGRLCQCRNGHLKNCTRIRKYFSSMSVQERFIFIKAFAIITTRENLKKQFKDLANSYRDYFSRYIHTRRYFLPWHRAFLLKVENLLRAVDCRITIPYWDWTLIPSSPWRNSANDVWNSLRGFGGNGVGKEKCVDSGPFRVGEWNLEKNDGSKECLKRNFRKNPKLPDALIVRLALETPANDFENFELMLRVGFHHCVTCEVGGTMCSKESVWSPEYLLISSFIDSLWGKWQQKGQKRWPIGFRDVSDLLPGFSIYTGDILQLSKQPGCVRVIYDESQSKVWKKMADLSSDLRNTSHPRQHSSLRYTKRAERLYGRLTKEEQTHLTHLL